MEVNWEGEVTELAVGLLYSAIIFLTYFSFVIAFFSASAFEQIEEQERKRKESESDTAIERAF